MTTSELWQRDSASASSSPDWAEDAGVELKPRTWYAGTFWMIQDAITIFGSALITVFFERHTEPELTTNDLWYHNVILDTSSGTLLAVLCAFCLVLIITSRMMNLYAPVWQRGILYEQLLSVMACAISALLVSGALYLVPTEDSLRAITLATVGLVTISLSLRRVIYRWLIYRRLGGDSIRNILILGNGPEARALRQQLEVAQHPGYRFKGYMDLLGSGSRPTAFSSSSVGTLDMLFEYARKQNVHEIFFTNPLEPGIVQELLEQAGRHGIDLRMTPVDWGGFIWNSPLESIGALQTLAATSSSLHYMNLALKRVCDIVLSALVLLIFPLLLFSVAIAIKLDSRGPVFYFSDRVGKNGRVFRLIKFRTMVNDADRHRADLLQKNERDGVLFKISNDPRITRVGRILRKYSIDELPQFFNVLRGDMSVVGPRPPLVSEVWGYKAIHLRRLEVTPGITGLWQVMSRQDPSFDNYISLDCSYIENWSVWLDFKIIARTIGVVIAGTGS
jgi:exopolysaccharide biosynthesis polyprenyl glycosylphosphotransferase